MKTQHAGDEGFDDVHDSESMTLMDIKRILANWNPAQKISASNAEIQVIDLFCGCGGMSLGFAAVGQSIGAFKIVGAVDIDQHALSSYRFNFSASALNFDVRDLAANDHDFEEFIGSLPDYKKNKPLVLIGCAPCQGFSAHRKGRWEEKDSRNGLVRTFADIAVKLEPDCVIMENVPELLSERYWSYFKAFRDRLTSIGYTVKQAILNTAGFGVPQERFRALVIAMKIKKYDFPKAFLQPTEFKTVRDAIGDLPDIEPGKQAKFDWMHRSANHRSTTLDVIRSVPKDGGKRPSGIGPRCLDRIKGYSDVYGRLFWDKPAITITRYARNPASGRFVHPEQDRGLTMREAARLQGFPDKFHFEGNFDGVFKQIGEAVPPPFSTAIALQVLANIRGDSLGKRRNHLINTPVSDSYGGIIAGIKRGYR